MGVGRVDDEDHEEWLTKDPFVMLNGRSIRAEKERMRRWCSTIQHVRVAAHPWGDLNTCINPQRMSTLSLHFAFPVRDRFEVSPQAPTCVFHSFPLSDRWKSARRKLATVVNATTAHP